MSGAMRTLLVLAAALGLAGCSAVGDVSKIASSRAVPIGQEFELARGEVVHLDGTSVSVIFDAVLEDSRCPMNARCIWAGNARVQVSIGVGSTPSHEFNTSDRFTTRRAILDYDFVLVNLQPVPMTGEKVEKYVITMRAEKPR
jgi:hypothetical protein